MKVLREGNIREGNIQTGDVLVLELHERDIVDLAEPTIGYRMERFSHFPHQRSQGGFGWQGEDKVHVRMKNGEDEPDKLARLALDPGGDLNFTIYDGPRLITANNEESFPAEPPFLIRDPSEKLVRLGIETVRIFGLMAIAQELHEPRWLQPS